MVLETMLSWLDARQAPATTGPLPQQSLDLSTYPTTPRQQFALAIVVLFPVLAVLIVGLRIHWRFKTKALGIDDAFIVAATILAVAEGGVSYVMVKLTYIGVHVWQIPTAPYDPTLGRIFNYVVVMLYNPQLGLVKSSVLFFLLRLEGEQKPGLRRAIHWLNWSNIALLIAVLFASIFTCVPVQKYWDRSLPGVCNNQPVQYLLTSSITVLTDVLVLAIPIYLVIGLQMSRKLKIGLIAVLCAGVVVTVFSILRLHMLAELYFTPRVGDWSYGIGFVYSTVECNVAIISASVPALYNFSKQWISPHGKSKNSNGPGSQDSGGYKASGGSGNSSGGAARFGSSGRSHHPAEASLRAASNGGGGSETGVALRDLKGSRWSSRAYHTRLESMNNSEEEILVDERKITRTTQIEMRYDNRV